MKEKTISEIQEIYDLELERIIKNVKKQKVKKILLQFPEGLKPYSQKIAEYLEENTNQDFFIWLDSCYGACDLPLEVERLGIDLIVQFGHSNWSYKDVKILK